MSLRIAQTQNRGDQTATIMVESTTFPAPRAIEELQGLEARRIALAEAVKMGIASPAIDGLLMHPYAVDKDGQPLAAGEMEKVAAYRVDVPVRAGLR